MRMVLFAVFILIAIQLLVGCGDQSYCNGDRTRSDIDYCNCNPKECQPSDYEPIDWENL